MCCIGQSASSSAPTGIGTTSWHAQIDRTQTVWIPRENAALWEKEHRKYQAHSRADCQGKTQLEKAVLKWREYYFQNKLTNCKPC